MYKPFSSCLLCISECFLAGIKLHDDEKEEEEEEEEEEKRE